MELAKGAVTRLVANGQLDRGAADLSPVDRARRRLILVGIFLGLIQLVGGTIGAIGTYASICVAVAVVLKREWRDLAVLLVLHLPAGGFGASLEGEPLAGLGRYFPDPSKFVHIGGVQVDVPLACVLAATAHIFVRLAVHGVSVIGGSRTLFTLWFVALIPAIGSSIYGWSSGLNGWSTGARGVMCLVGLVWGTELADADTNVYSRDRRLIASIVGGCVLFAARLITDHLVFLLAGLTTGSIPYFLRSRKYISAALTMACAAALAMQATFTTLGIVVLAGALSVTAFFVRSRALRGTMLMATAGTTVLVVVMTITFALQTKEVDFAAESTQVTADKTVGDLSYKIVSDRGMLWRPAMELVLEGPYLIVPSGRPIPFRGSRQYVYWTSGAHNAVIQTLVQTGVVSGTIVGILILAAASRMVRLLAQSEPSLDVAIASGVAAVAIMGSVTGNFPVVDQVGFLIWTATGYVWARHRRSCSLLGGQVERA